MIARILTRDPAEAKRRAELRRIIGRFSERRLPYFRAKQNSVLPPFAEAVCAFARLLHPLRDLARATVGHPDARTAQRGFDWLIESRLPAAARDRLLAFGYEGMKERVAASLEPERAVDAINEEFQAYLRELEALGARKVNAELAEVDRFIDLCGYDWERLLGLFDPAAAVDDPGWKPDFSPADGEQVLPELIDLQYALAGFSFTESLKRNLGVLLERRNPDGGEGRKRKLDKLFQRLQEILDRQLDGQTLLDLVRAVEGDPDRAPEAPSHGREHFDAYRRRLVLQFDRSLERLRRERHETSVTGDIKALFGDAEVLELDAYDDDTDALLRRESPHSLPWIKPLRILKTFIPLVFEPLIHENAKRVLVEGYFDNKVFQNNLANIIYQCERSAGRIAEFESQMSSNGRISITALRRYVEELRRGKDMAVFLERLADAVNGRAGEIVEDETGLFSMLAEALGEIVADAKRPAPELVANLRNLGGGRNREILAQLAEGRDRLLVLLRILRNFVALRGGPEVVSTTLDIAPPPSFDGGAGAARGEATGGDGGEAAEEDSEEEGGGAAELEILP